ncbi:IS66 family insertion sequence element accessory protein TnpA [Anaeromicropila populeti]|uniref:Uncharacterized protein n=1 Tax=Anaeromicropila populeti TaxID=37658 RepID=A0A1I6K791_9FIRM|nr:hypothetical protein [Anaeromicropila populeti]SFR87091.1 hypothetical protein SAMN05661086_02249 [Anaeromicropila populeti]
MNTEESIELWSKRFSDRKLSRLKVDVWCEKNHISRHAYYYWHRKIQVIKQREEKKDTFVEVAHLSLEAIPISQENKAIDLVITWNGFSITIRKSADIPIVAELMQRLVRQC